MELSPVIRIRQRTGRRYRGVQLSGRRHNCRKRTESRLLHPQALLGRPDDQQ